MQSENRSIKKTIRNQRGQGLVEYLIIVALMGVASIAVIRVLGQAVNSRFATVANALQGVKKSEAAKIDKSAYKSKDLGNFFDGVESNQ